LAALSVDDTKANSASAGGAEIGIDFALPFDRADACRMIWQPSKHVGKRQAKRADRH
jgi:hypothetical protein